MKPIDVAVKFLGNVFRQAVNPKATLKSKDWRNENFNDFSGNISDKTLTKIRRIATELVGSALSTR